MRQKILSSAACLLLSACATIVNGSNQSMTVSTDPPGASCTLTRKGETVGAVPMTPGSVQISKSKDDVSVTCERQGYQTATITKSPSFGGATFANILLGGGVGAIVDAASGANYTYPSEMHLVMAPLQAPAPTVAQPAIPSVIPVAAVAPATPRPGGH